MYYQKKIDSMFRCDDAIIEKYSVMLLQYLFCVRADERKNDIPFIQSLIDYNYITKTKIVANIDEPAIYIDSISPILSNVISAISNEASHNEVLSDIIVAYFFKELFPDYSYNKQTSPTEKTTRQRIPQMDELLQEYAELRLSREQSVILSYVLLVEARKTRDRSVLDMVLEVCSKGKWIPCAIALSERTLLETISDFLGEDIVGNEVFIKRLVSRRTDELYNYLLRQKNKYSQKSPCFTSEKDKRIYICENSCGLRDRKYHSKNRNNESDDEDSDESSIGVSQLPFGKVAVNSFVDMLAETISACYDKIYYASNELHFVIISEEGAKAYQRAILEELLDRLSRNLVSKNSEPIQKRQVIRMLSYSDYDCSIVMEKIASSLQATLIATSLKNIISKDISSADYENLQQFTWMAVNKADNKEKSIIEEATNEAIDSYRVTLAGEKTKINQLKKENKQLQERLLELQNQLNRRDKATNTISDLKKKIEILVDENENLNKRIDCLRENKSSDLSPALEVQQELTIDEDFFLDKRFIIVGGMFQTNRELKKFFPKAQFVSKKTDDMVDVRAYDFVVFFTDYMDHSMYGKFKNKCRIHNIPMLYLNNTSPETIKKSIYLYYNERNTIE